MANLRILATNRYTATTTTLTASSSAANLPPGASVNPDRSYVWRSLEETGVQTIDIDLGSVLAVDSVAVANVKLVGTGVLELYQRGDAGSPGVAALVATLPTQDRDTRAAFAFFSTQSHRHWQLRWTNPTAADDYAELGYACLGPALELSRNVRVPADFARVDPSVPSLSVDGQQTHARRTKYFAGRWQFDDVADAALDELREVFDTLGTSSPHFVVLDDARAWTCWLQRFVGQLGAGFGVLAGRYSIGMAWEEAR